MAGGCLVIGCNTVSHLSPGRFELCRVGDDTSGTDWSWTRKMGVNSLAFRGAQHNAFYAADADCVGVTNSVPWKLNAQWLLAAKQQPLGEPLDWQNTVYPEHWRLMNRERPFDWMGTDGAGLPE
jgi:alpha-galactosidase